MKKILLVLGLCVSIFLSACTQGKVEKEPEEFSFKLTWNTYGVSSYDSETGKLVKTTDATHPEDYVTEYFLTEEELDEIYKLIAALDMESSPKEYDPFKGEMSEPSQTLILEVCIDGEEMIIKAEDISLSDNAGNKKGQRFLDVCDTISGMLMDTKEWEALPEYEFLYE